MYLSLKSDENGRIWQKFNNKNNNNNNIVNLKTTSAILAAVQKALIKKKNTMNAWRDHLLKDDLVKQTALLNRQTL